MNCECERDRCTFPHHPLTDPLINPTDDRPRPTRHNTMPLLSCHVSGIFPLSGGFRRSDPSYYAEYLSSLEFPVDDKFINVSVRRFTPTSESLLADNSFVFLVAKAAIPADGDGMLDTIHCTPFTPLPPGSEQPITIDPTHTAFVTGTVRSISNGDDSVRSFTVLTGEWVRGEQRTFDLRFVVLLYSHSYVWLTLVICTFIVLVSSTMERLTAGKTFDFLLWDLLSPSPAPLKMSLGMNMIIPY